MIVEVLHAIRRKHTIAVLQMLVLFTDDFLANALLALHCVLITPLALRAAG